MFGAIENRTYPELDSFDNDKHLNHQNVNSSA